MSLYIQPMLQNTFVFLLVYQRIHAGPLCFSTSPTSHWSKPRLVLGQRRGEQWIHHLGVHQELDHLWWERQRHWGTAIPPLTANKKTCNSTDFWAEKVNPWLHVVVDWIKVFLGITVFCQRGLVGQTAEHQCTKLKLVRLNFSVWSSCMQSLEFN